MTATEGHEGSVRAGSCCEARLGAGILRPHAIAIAIVAAFCFAFASTAHAALEAELHEVNTSVGLLPTSTTNVWKLETDPSTPDLALADYIPSEGMLNNSFNPADFQLAVSPYTNTFALGYTVQGLGAFQVTSFAVQMSGGGYINVEQDPTNPNNSILQDFGNVSGTETGVVSDIYFTVIPSLINEDMPATDDQLFFQVNLVAQDPAPAFNPGVGTVFATTDSFFTIIPANPLDTTDPTIVTNLANGTINGASTVPEPGAGIAMVAGMAGFLALRRPVKWRA